MKRIFLIFSFISMLLAPSGVPAVEVAPRMTDREIIERLTRLEEGQRRIEEFLRAEIQANAQAIRQLGAEMNAQFGRIDTQFNRVDAQFDRVDAQFDRIIRMMLGILAAFATLVAATIGFALWDRRTMIRPFESKVKEIEADLSQNRQRLHALIEALGDLSQTDERVAAVLRKFNLL